MTWLQMISQFLNWCNKRVVLAISLSYPDRLHTAIISVYFLCMQWGLGSSNFIGIGIFCSGLNLKKQFFIQADSTCFTLIIFKRETFLGTFSTSLCQTYIQTLYCWLLFIFIFSLPHFLSPVSCSCPSDPQAISVTVAISSELICMARLEQINNMFEMCVLLTEHTQITQRLYAEILSLMSGYMGESFESAF